MRSILLSLGLLLSHSSYAECKVMSPEEFSKLLTPQVKRLVFFASWCKSCEQHLTDEYAKDSIFVAVFDEKAKAQAVLVSRLQGKESFSCVFDQDESISKNYGLKFLPFLKVL